MVATSDLVVDRASKNKLLLELDLLLTKMKDPQVPGQVMICLYT